MLEKAQVDAPLLKGLGRIILQLDRKRQNEKVAALTPAAQDELRHILTTVLRSILLDIKVSIEALHDFEYLWESCIDKCSSSQHNFGLEVDNEEATKAFVWMLSCVISLHCRVLKKNAKHTNTLNSFERRRHRILLSITCIALVFWDISLYDNVSETSPKFKRRRVDEMEKDRTVDHSYSCGKKKDIACKYDVRNSEHRLRLSLEDDAIVALSMMGTSSDSPSTNRRKPNLFQKYNRMKKCSACDDLINILIRSANDLLLYISTPKQSKSSSNLSRADVDKKMSHTAAHVAKFYASRLKSEVIGDSTHKGLPNDNFSFRSVLETEDRRYSNLNFLRTMYKELMHLIPESKSDAQSFLSNLKYVDDTMLCMSISNDIRSALTSCYIMKDTNDLLTKMEMMACVVVYSPQVQPAHTVLPTIFLHNRGSLPQIRPENTVISPLLSVNSTPALSLSKDKGVDSNANILKLPPVRIITESMELNGE